MTLDLGGESLRVRGAIDRIDVQGDRAIVVDYKSGSTQHPRQTRSRTGATSRC